MLLGEDRRTGSDAADYRQAIVVVGGTWFEAGDANAARGTWRHLDSAFTCQRLEVFLCRVG